MGPAYLRAATLCVLIGLLYAGWQEPAVAALEFKGYEIRVIRPRYVVKARRAELGVGLSAVMNQSFLYSYLATGILTWHLSEVWAFEGQAAFGTTFDRDEKRVLDDDFNINTVILRTEMLANGRVVWTPSYGKYFLTSSHIVYFDTFISAGAGVSGIRYTFKHCDEPGDDPPSARSKQYPTMILGIGQRHFIDRASSVRIGADWQRFSFNTADGACGADAPGLPASHDNIILSLGWSRFL